MAWHLELDNAIADARQVAKLAGATEEFDQIQIELLPSPHEQPKRQPAGFMAVYLFYGHDQWLKVGMVGPNSNARYTSQHYNAASSRSNLAKSLLHDPELGVPFAFNAGLVREWILADCHRANILVPVACGRPLVALLEAFLHVRLEPRFER